VKLKKNRAGQALPAGQAVTDVAEKSATKSAGGWLRIIKNNHALTVVGGVALLSLGFGLGASNLFVGEAGAAVEAPEPGLITVPVEFRHLNNDVTIRADFGFADSADVTLNTTGFDAPVVTGAIPEAGYELDALSIALEIAGRPVIVLPGELPAYRTLTVGMSGPDVIQFKQAMQSLGINAGDPTSPLFDATAANAVRELYARVGYPVPASLEGGAAAATAAQIRLDDAQRALTGAIIEADRAIRDAQNDWEAWPCEDPSPECRAHRLALDNALARPLEVAARQEIADAQIALENARQNALPQLPVSEVLFLNNLPRRVDSVNITRGQMLSGVSMRVSGAVLQLRGSATEANARLLNVGDEAFFDLPDGGTHRAEITEIRQPTGDGSRWSIEFSPDPLSPEQFMRLQAANVRVQIPIGATQGDVLVVPVAALTAGPGGEARVEVVDGDPRLGAGATTRLVVVEAGLAAEGFVEVTPVNGGSLAEGDLVVVGR